MTTVDNQSIVGALNIFNAALANPGMISDAVTQQATRFLAQGKIPVMMFGLPAAALVLQLPLANHMARTLQPIDDLGDACGGDREAHGKLGRGQRAVGDHHSSG